MANEFASRNAHIVFFRKLARGPQPVQEPRRVHLFSAADADVVVAGQVARRFDEMKAQFKLTFFSEGKGHYDCKPKFFPAAPLFLNGRPAPA